MATMGERMGRGATPKKGQEINHIEAIRRRREERCCLVLKGLVQRRTGFRKRSLIKPRGLARDLSHERGVAGGCHVKTGHGLEGGNGARARWKLPTVK